MSVKNPPKNQIRCRAGKGWGQFVPIFSYGNLLHHQLNKLQLKSINLAKDQ